MVDLGIAMLKSIELDLKSAIRKAERLTELNGHSVFDGQVRYYLIPWLTKFIEDKHQLGSLACLREMLDKED